MNLSFAKRNIIPGLSRKESIALKLLLNSDHEMYGLEMVKASEGQLKPGTIYNTLGRMEVKGYINSRKGEGPPEMGGLPQRFYSISNYGRRIADACREDVDIDSVNTSLAYS